MTGEDRTTPRPWVTQSFGDHHLIHGPDEGGLDIGALIGELDMRADNARLIVTAVNQYDRLRAIEEAARAICLTEDEAAALRDILAMLATIVRAERAAEQFAEMCPVHTFIRLADCEVHGAPHE